MPRHFFAICFATVFCGNVYGASNIKLGDLTSNVCEAGEAGCFFYSHKECVFAAWASENTARIKINGKTELLKTIEDRQILRSNQYHATVGDKRVWKLASKGTKVELRLITKAGSSCDYSGDQCTGENYDAVLHVTKGTESISLPVSGFCGS
jgi:hypothetical protein